MSEFGNIDSHDKDTIPFSKAIPKLHGLNPLASF